MSGPYYGMGYAILITPISYWAGGHTFLHALEVGLVGGLLIAITNITSSYKFAVPRYVIQELTIEIDEAEDITFQAPANYTSLKKAVVTNSF